MQGFSNTVGSTAILWGSAGEIRTYRDSYRVVHLGCVNVLAPKSIEDLGRITHPGRSLNRLCEPRWSRSSSNFPKSRVPRKSLISRFATRRWGSVLRTRLTARPNELGSTRRWHPGNDCGDVADISSRIKAIRTCSLTWTP